MFLKKNYKTLIDNFKMCIDLIRYKLHEKCAIKTIREHQPRGKAVGFEPIYQRFESSMLKDSYFENESCSEKK